MAADACDAASRKARTRSSSHTCRISRARFPNGARLLTVKSWSFAQMGREARGRPILRQRCCAGSPTRSVHVHGSRQRPPAVDPPLDLESRIEEHAHHPLVVVDDVRIEDVNGGTESPRATSMPCLGTCASVGDDCSDRTADFSASRGRFRRRLRERVREAVAFQRVSVGVKIAPRSAEAPPCDVSRLSPPQQLL